MRLRGRRNGYPGSDVMLSYGAAEYRLVDGLVAGEGVQAPHRAQSRGGEVKVRVCGIIK